MAIIGKELEQDARLGSVLKRLVMETGWRHAPAYAVALLLTLIIAATTTGVAYFAGEVFGAVFEEQNGDLLAYVAWGVAGLFILRGLATFGHAVIITQIGNEILLETQLKMFSKIIAQEPSYISKSSTGEIGTLINKSATSSQALMNAIVVSIGRDLFTLIGLLGFMVWLNWTMSLVILVVIPVIVVVITSITKRVRMIARRQLAVSVQLGNRIRGSIQGVRVVKAFGMEKQLNEVLRRNASQIREYSNKHAMVSNRVAPVMEALAGVGFGLAIGFGGGAVLEAGDGSAAQLVSFVTAAFLAYDPGRRLGQARANIENSLVGIRLMYRFLDEEIPGPDRIDAKPFLFRAGEVRLENVSFSYAADKPVLRDVSFTAPAGKTTALVGRSGSGKTTVANLLQRFWRVQEGRILIDGQNVDDLQVASLRSHIAFVGQDAFMFDGTFRENIIVGDPEASEEALHAAAAAADALEFIKASPEGFDSPVGELGSKLSGGQRQRVAIARALLRDAPIVVLDEPTSALDMATERSIQASLDRLSTGRTTIVIAHRLSTIENADHIVVLEDGRVVEQGDKSSLLRANGAFARLYANSSAELEDS